jgi:FkbM family methyltransferase
MECWNINRIVDNFNLNDSFVFFDIGTNTGQELEVLLPLGVDVHSFEPHPKLAKQIREQFKSYGNLVFNESGAWIKNENKTFFYKRALEDDQIDGGSTLIASKININTKWKTEVQCIDISEYVFNFKNQIDIMKIDIEGSEYHVIKHLIDTGAIERINNIFFEDHSRKIPRYFNHYHGDDWRIRQQHSTEFYDNKKFVLDQLDSFHFFTSLTFGVECQGYILKTNFGSW